MFTSTKLVVLLTAGLLAAAASTPMIYTGDGASCSTFPLTIASLTFGCFQDTSTPPVSVLAVSSTTTIRTLPPSLTCSLTARDREFANDQISHEFHSKTLFRPAFSGAQPITLSATRPPRLPVRETLPFAPRVPLILVVNSRPGQDHPRPADR